MHRAVEDQLKHDVHGRRVAFIWNPPRTAAGQLDENATNQAVAKSRVHIDVWSTGLFC
jgi:hypothetical protein